MLKSTLLRKLDTEFSITIIRNIFSCESLTKHDAQAVLNNIRARKQQTAHIYGLYLGFLARKGEKEGVRDGIKLAQSDGLSISLRGVLATLYAACRQLKPTLYILEFCPRPHPLDFSFCVSQLGTSLDIMQKFEELWEMRKGRFIHSEVVASTFSFQYGKLGDKASASRWLDQIQALGLPVRPKIRQLLKAGGDLELMKHWISEVKRRGENPDAMEFYILVSAASSRGDGEALRHWLKEMENANITFNSLIKPTTTVAEIKSYLLEMNNAGIRLTAHLYNSIIRQAVALENLTQASIWLEQMKFEKLTPNMTIYNSMITLAARLGNWTVVQHVLDNMKEAMVHPNEYTFNALVSGSASVGDAKEAENWAQEMKKSGLQPDIVTFNGLIHAAAKRDDVRGIQHWLGQMEEAGIRPDARTFTGIISAGVGDARQWYEAMRRQGIKPDGITYKSLITVAAKQSNEQEAVHWLGELKREGLQPSFRTLSSLLEYATDVNKLQHWLGEIRKEGITINSKEYNDTACYALMDGDENRAMFWLEEMKRNGAAPNIRLFYHFVNLAVVNGNKQAAKHWMQETKKAGLRLSSALENRLCVEAEKHGDKTGYVKLLLEEMKK